ncbi:glutathione S-transferase family protein [Paracoccus sp. p4-l81]|uniref:glutathione S-transferase family protein n=1 Tax=Paracoccus sp. p4-l81 TaxID=3342806 RepID=UPI0035B8292A
MLTFYHAPNSRSTLILALLRELDAVDQVNLVRVDIPRQDGSGARDAANPHPEGKVPYLTDGDDWLRERGAICLYLTDRFPAAGLGPLPDQPGRGRYVSWLSYYQGVVEPVMIFDYLGLSHPALMATFRDMPAMFDRLDQALAEGPYLLGDRFSAADLLIASPFGYFPDMLPDDRPAIRDWVGRVLARPSLAWAKAQDAAG